MTGHSAVVRMSLTLPDGREWNVSHSGPGYLRVRGDEPVPLGWAFFWLSVDGRTTEYEIDVTAVDGQEVTYTRKGGE